MVQHPKFEGKIRRKIVDESEAQKKRPGYGMVMKYNKYRNTASVLMARRGSDRPGEIYEEVPCPTELGVHKTAPEVGRLAWLEFKDDSGGKPVITHFFSTDYHGKDFYNHIKINNSIPNYLGEL